LETLVPQQTAKIFSNGGSQAVRLPAEFRFEDATEVYIRRDAVSGDVILSPRRRKTGWSEFFTRRDAATVSNDFLVERPLNLPLEAPEPPGQD
jgi:antitoxin VapB